jgi:hypothetical protein
LISGDEHHPRSFKRLLHGVNVRSCAPPRPNLTFHASDGLQGDTCGRGKLGSTPPKKGPRRSNLRGGHHDKVLFDTFMVLLD